MLTVVLFASLTGRVMRSLNVKHWHTLKMVTSMVNLNPMQQHELLIANVSG
jgi:hypothetical protein